MSSRIKARNIVDGVKPMGGTVEGTGLHIRWQEGPVINGEPNGALLEDVLDAVRQRLEFFQRSPMRCRENAVAVTKLQEARMWLEERTKRRQLAGIEGTFQADDALAEVLTNIAGQPLQPPPQPPGAEIMAAMREKGLRDDAVRKVASEKTSLPPGAQDRVYPNIRYMGRGAWKNTGSDVEVTLPGGRYLWEEDLTLTHPDWETKTAPIALHYPEHDLEQAAIRMVKASHRGHATKGPDPMAYPDIFEMGGGRWKNTGADLDMVLPMSNDAFSVPYRWRRGVMLVED